MAESPGNIHKKGLGDKVKVYMLLVFILALIVSVFAVQNSYLVDINFLWWTFRQVSLVMVILSSFTVGALAALLLILARQFRSTMKMRELTIVNRQLAEEINRIQAEKNQDEPELVK